MSTLTLTSALGQALDALGILDSGGAANLTSVQLADGLITANNLIESKSQDRLFANSALITSFSLGSGTQAYTIGSGQTINIVRPAEIEAATLRLSNGLTKGIKVVNAIEWSMLDDRDRQSYLVKNLFYDRGSPTAGSVRLSPIPLGGTAEIITWLAMTPFADATTPITMSPGYSRWFVYAFAFELAAQYISAQVTPAFLADLADATAELRNLNASLFGIAPPAGQVSANTVPPSPIAPTASEAA